MSSLALSQAMTKLTHLNEKGEARMVDVSEKSATQRTAVICLPAGCVLRTCSPESASQIFKTLSAPGPWNSEVASTMRFGKTAQCRPNRS